MRAWSRPLPLLVATAVLAGCLGGGDDTVDAPDTTADPLVHSVIDGQRNVLAADAFGGEIPQFTILQSSDRISGEPTLGVTRTGAVFYAAIEFDVDVAGQTTLPSTWYMRTTDGGETWEDRSPQIAGVKTHPTSFDPYVYVDPTTGRVFAMDMGPHVVCNKVSWSDDDGETWTTREGACVPGVNDHPSLFAGPAGPLTNTAVYPNNVYLCTNQVSDTICYVSPDGGINWIMTAPSYLGYDLQRAGIDPDDPDPTGGLFDGLCGGLAGHGHASWTDGTVYLGRDWCGEVTVATSEDHGVTWTVNKIAAGRYHQPSEHDVSIATDKAGNAYAFWLGDRGRTAFLSVSNDQGRTWSQALNVTAPGVTGVRFPSIVAGEEGRIAFLYVGTENPYGNRVGSRVDGCDDAQNPACFEYPDAYNNATWNAYIGVSLNAHTGNATFATVLANPVDEPLKRGACSGRCFGDTGGMYDFLDIDIDPMTGQVWAALVDVCSGDCDGAGKGKFDVDETAVGAVAKLVSGVTLLDTPIAQR